MSQPAITAFARNIMATVDNNLDSSNSTDWSPSDGDSLSSTSLISTEDEDQVIMSEAQLLCQQWGWSYHRDSSDEDSVYSSSTDDGLPKVPDAQLQLSDSQAALQDSPPSSEDGGFLEEKDNLPEDLDSKVDQASIENKNDIAVGSIELPSGVGGCSHKQTPTSTQHPPTTPLPPNTTTKQKKKHPTTANQPAITSYFPPSQTAPKPQSTPSTQGPISPTTSPTDHLPTTHSQSPQLQDTSTHSTSTSSLSAFLAPHKD